MPWKNAKHIQMLWLLFFDNLQSHCPIARIWNSFYCSIQPHICQSLVMELIWNRSFYGTQCRYAKPHYFTLLLWRKIYFNKKNKHWRWAYEPQRKWRSIETFEPILCCFEWILSIGKKTLCEQPQICYLVALKRTSIWLAMVLRAMKIKYNKNTSPILIYAMHRWNSIK